jgi:serine/threonine-protein kinase RsbW
MGFNLREVCPQEVEHCHDLVEGWHCASIHSTPEMYTVIERVLDDLHASGYTRQETFSVRLALEEAIVNAIKHGHHNDLTKEVQVRYHISSACVLAAVQDEGEGFCPEDVPDPLAPENLESDHGRGLLLMRNYMTWVRYNQSGTCVTLCKQRGHQ